MPFQIIADWLNQAKAADRAILATCFDNIPHSRVVAIREIVNESLIFFTQRSTRKVFELTENPQASITFWLAMQQRQINLEGIAKPLSRQENEQYWQALPKERQLRFAAYAPSSGQVIQSLSELEAQERILIQEYKNSKAIPMSEFYYGYRFRPETIIFYTLGTHTFSKVEKYTKDKAAWQKQLLSP